MNWLEKLPGFQRARPGLEWAIWKRLPAVLFWGLAIPLAGVMLLGWPRSEQASLDAADAEAELLMYQLIGLMVLHATVVLTVAVGCGIVMLMKGPAYVADPYPPQGRDDAV